MANKKQLMALMLSGLIGVAQADEKEELLKLRNTTTNLIKQLVKQGILTDKMAKEMIKQAEVDADKQVAETKSANAAATGASSGSSVAAATGQMPAGGQVASNGQSQTGGVAGSARPVVPADEVRVSYVPDFVKDEIRQQVRNELREEVVGDVMKKAKDEQWGIPDALPEWTRRFKLSGDIRLREQSSIMAGDNITLQQNMNSLDFLNYQAINSSFNANNAAQGQTNFSNMGQNGFLNTTQNQNLARERFRLGIDAVVTDGVDAGVRLAASNTPNPVSTNQTLGNTGIQYQFVVDRAFIRYNANDSTNYNWLTLMGGRTLNPFFTAGSELVWDEDLSFEGLAGTVRQRLTNSGLSDEFGGKGPSVFATAGIFPMQAQNPLTGLSSLQKWMAGGQAGLDWGFDNQDSLKVGAAYYDYQNIKAKLNKNSINTCDTNTADMTQSAPQYVQGGNSMVGICYEGSQSNPGKYYGLYGLASDYKILDFNLLYDMALFAPIHAKLSGDYAKNIGFDKSKIAAYTGHSISDQTTAWQVKFDLGWSKIEKFGSWNIFAAYKYLERDAVLDSYTDSDFHLGGTNVKGWWIGGNYGLMKNVWLTGRWLSGDMISTPWNVTPSAANNYGKFGVDVLQIDLNTRF